MTQNVPEFLKHQFVEFAAFRKALTDESDRGCALFAAAYLDTALEQLFRASLLENKKIDEDLFEGSAPLATFSGRIKLAYYLGLISAEFRADLETIRKIRNEFAHDATILSFDTQSIADRCRNLGFSYHKPDATPRGHFTAAASGLLGRLHALTVKASQPATKPDDRPAEAEKSEVRERVEAAMKSSAGSKPNNA